MSDVRDVAVIGGGIVGLATARALLREHDMRPMVLEAEPGLATHQTGHNSGVIHSGLYYKPGSRKARDSVVGREALYAFCRERGIEHEMCGKLVVATDDRELPTLDEVERRGRANGLRDLRQVGREEIRSFEPHAHGSRALWVPETGIVDFTAVAKAMAKELWEGGAEIRVAARVERVRRSGDHFDLQFAGESVAARRLVNCGGLQSDRVARMCGLDPGLRIVPVRGEYRQLASDREHLVRNLIYPVPDPELPFLGVHFTRKLGGGIEIGPNAVPAWSRSGYGRGSVSARDLFSMLSWPGTWRMAFRHRRYAMDEIRCSWSKAAFIEQARRLVPEIGPDDLARGGVGIRAQAVARDGVLIDDFRVIRSEGMVHVLNAPSPAATASLAIGAHIASLIS